MSRPTAAGRSVPYPLPEGDRDITTHILRNHPPQQRKEGDLIIGTLGGSAIATLVERSSRFVMLGHLGRERTAEAVRDSLITTVRHLPASLRGTLTWDQGAEMAEHRAFTAATNFDVYFADAGAPWQRGSFRDERRALSRRTPF
ncbi:IS30 family transposase [Rhodococcus sp. ACPA4]|uniref:IS30 family transposase n=1 Tax=Rhodococcus sp. ACPA4 TaxID=2028571 RepID=UPI00359C91FE